jgi:hypothetical protein
MSRALKERIKNIIILILVVAGILQVGILVGYQSQWTPTNFIRGLLNPPLQISISDVEARERLFTPNRLILSNGEKLCVINKADEIYENLWVKVQGELQSIVKGAVSVKSYSEIWDSLVVKKGIIIDFGYPIKPELLKWFLGEPKMNMDIPDILKILINPDIVDPNTGVIYICDSNGKVYESDTVIFGTGLNLDEEYVSVSGSGKYRLYNTFRSANIDTAQDAPGDILFVNSSPRYWTYYEYSCRIPARAMKSYEFAMIVLGNEKDRYNVSKSKTDDMIQYEYNSIYRFYSDGCLTYQNPDTVDSSGKEGMSSALLNTYKFINRINQLSDSAADIVLTDIETDKTRQGVYDISFDYYLKGMPVRFGSDVRVGNGDKLVHAVNIQADSKKVLKCEWLLRDFTQSGKNNYNDRFIDLMSLTKHSFDEKKLNINDVLTGYFIESTRNEQLAPKMLIELKDKSTVQIEMPME